MKGVIGSSKLSEEKYLLTNNEEAYPKIALSITSIG